VNNFVGSKTLGKSEMRGAVIDTGDAEEEDSDEESAPAEMQEDSDEEEEQETRDMEEVPAGSGRTKAASTSAKDATYDMKKREPLYAHAEVRVLV
jgi:hypothetical protein